MELLQGIYCTRKYLLVLATIIFGISDHESTSQNVSWLLFHCTSVQLIKLTGLKSIRLRCYGLYHLVNPDTLKLSLLS